MKRFVLLLLLFTLGLSQLQGQINVDYWLNNGRQKIIRNDNVAAIDYMNTLLRFVPDMAEAFYLRAIAKFNLGDYRGSIVDCSHAIGIDSIYYEFYLLRGKARQNLYDYAGARQDFSHVIWLRPVETDAFLNRGINSLITKNYNEAIKDFNQAIELNHSSPYGYLYRAIGLQMDSCYDEALIDFNRAIQLNPLNSDAYVRRGRNYLDMHNFARAIEDLDKAIKIDKANSFAWYNRAMAKSQNNDDAGALADLDQVIKLEPENDLAFFSRSELRAKAGNLSGALEDLNQVVFLNKTNVYTYFNRAIIYFRMGNYKKAVADYTTAISLFPEFATAYYNRSIAKSKLKDMAGARKDYETALNLNKALDKNGNISTIDSTGLAKLIEFKAGFNEANFTLPDNEPGIYPCYNYAIRYLPVDSFYNYQPAINEPLREINREGQKRYMFVLTADDKQLQPDTAENLLKTMAAQSYIKAGYRTLFARSILAMQYRDFVSALDNLDTIVENDHTLALAYFARANTRYEMTSYVNSLASSSMGMLLIGGNSTPANKKQQDYDQVMNDYTRSILLDPSLAPAYYNRANLKLEIKDYASAIEDFNNAISNSPKMAEAYYNRGLTYIYLQRTEQGCRDLSQAGELGLARSYNAIKRYCK